MPHATVFDSPYMTIHEQNGAAERAATRESFNDLLFVATLLFVTGFEPSNKEPPLTKRPPKLIGSNSFDRSAPPVYEKGSMPDPEVPRAKLDLFPFSIFCVFCQLFYPSSYTDSILPSSHNIISASLIYLLSRYPAP